MTYNHHYYHHHFSPIHPAHPLNPIHHHHHHRAQKTYTEVDSTAVGQVNNGGETATLKGGFVAIVLLVVMILVITFGRD